MKTDFGRKKGPGRKAASIVDDGVLLVLANRLWAAIGDGRDCAASLVV